jgi:NCS1 family nucleobase:cation symporter-1
MNLIQLMLAKGGILALKEHSPVTASHWGIEPVPEPMKTLSGFDLAVLWGDLGIGVLVIATGALLVAPAEQFGYGLSLPSAMVAVVLGSLIGAVLLGIGGVIGTREGRPTMALFRSVLGSKGSWVPSVLNVAQLTGWTAVELWAMARIASILGKRLFGLGSFGFWLVIFTVLTLGLSLWGPLGVVRGWMERFGAWLIVAIGLAITAGLLVKGDIAAMWSRGGASGAQVFGLPLDLVIAIPVSWIPLVADYNRFCPSRRGSFWGTTVGFAIANAWFYGLGALLLAVVPSATPDPEGIALGVLTLAGVSIAGVGLLAGLVVGETDEAFADVYSGAVSLRNIFPRVDNRVLVAAVTLAGALLAARFTMLAYELFLFLLGSVFVPLTGVWFADYFVLRNRRPPGLEPSGVRGSAMIGWLAGFVVYHWIAPTPLNWWTGLTTGLMGTPLSQRLPWLGASLPSFAVAFAVHLVVGSIVRRSPAEEGLNA